MRNYLLTSRGVLPNSPEIVNKVSNYYFCWDADCKYFFSSYNLFPLHQHILQLIILIYIFQTIGVVVADTHQNARNAAGKVRVKYEDLPAILSIADAVKNKSFHPNTERTLTKGDVELCFQSGECDRVIEGQVQIGGQEHFYLEPNSSLVWTIDGGNEVHMISSTQVCFVCFKLYIKKAYFFSGQTLCNRSSHHTKILICATLEWFLFNIAGLR